MLGAQGKAGDKINIFNRPFDAPTFLFKVGEVYMANGKAKEMVYDIRKVDLRELAKAEYNPRVMDELQRTKLKKSVAEFNFAQPIVINADNTVISGHQRLWALLENGYTHAEAIYVDVDKKTEKKLNIAFNTISGDFDKKKLAEMLAELDDGTFDMESIGFDNIEVAEIITDELKSEDFDNLIEKDIEEGGLFSGLNFGGSFTKSEEEAKQDLIKKGEEQGNKAIVQYNIIFDEKEQQEKFTEFIKALKEMYPELVTIGSRITQYLDENFFDTETD